jgi:hypothetical protein
MKKRYIVGSIVIMLLMLVSTQLVFMKTVKSDPTIHYGDAHVGEFWVSELDVSNEIEEFEYIGIAHARGDHDWVAWDKGFGNISANWTIDIDSTSHPQYYIIYSLVVYNIDNEGQELGNATFSQFIDRDGTFDDSGTLTIPIKFSESEMNEWEDVTLVCYLGAFIQLNETEESRDFSCTADDRSVVAIDFEMPMYEPNFANYLDKANEGFPSMWSWIGGWESRFENEDEMLNEQTFFIVGTSVSTGSQQIDNTSWNLGNMSLRITSTPLKRLKLEGFTTGDLTIEWSHDEIGYISGWAYVNYSILHPSGWFAPVKFRAYIFENETKTIGEAIGWKFFNHSDPDKYFGTFKIPIWAAHINMDVNEDEHINVDGWVWAKTILPCQPVRLGKYGNYSIHINQSVNQTTDLKESSVSFYWEESCSYCNETSETLDVSSLTQFGITTVEADISNALQGEGQSIYSFAADRGDVRVEFTC